MKTVPLGGKKAAGRVAVVDDDDYELVMQYAWHIFLVTKEGRRPNGPYAIAGIRRGGRKTTIQMHKLITGWPMTDHIDHDGLNNRRSNLRPATRAQNAHNSRRQLRSASPFKGVSLNKPSGMWVAKIRIGGKSLHLGSFASEIDAARAYDYAAVEARGEYALTNFPGVPIQPPIPATRFCAECLLPIPDTRRSIARYCSKRCSQIATVRRQAPRRRAQNGWRKRPGSAF